MLNYVLRIFGSQMREGSESGAALKALVRMRKKHVHRVDGARKNNKNKQTIECKRPPRRSASKTS